jgi:site-specific DNA-cytosine methylase
MKKDDGFVINNNFKFLNYKHEKSLIQESIKNYPDNFKSSQRVATMSPGYQWQRVYSINAKATTLLTDNGMKIVDKDLKVRRLSVLECERLQNVPDDYTKAVSRTRRTHMLGNGYTVGIIVHILQGLKQNSKSNNLFDY